MKTRLARILRSRGFRAAVVLPTVLITFGAVTIDTARACWSTILQECFNRSIPQWPWDPPGPGTWKPCAVVSGQHICHPSLPSTTSRWGVHSGNYFDIVYCPDDDRSLWCYGYPVSHDPEYHNYPNNYDTYVMFGPFSLASAVAAQCVFRFWNDSQPFYDSLFWGATTAVNLANAAQMNIDTSRSTTSFSGWETRVMDLADLHNAVSGDSVSMIGQPVVYVFWRFKSNASVQNVGAFIDNVLIAVDDGQADIRVYPGEPTIELMNPDTTLITAPLSVGDTLFARYGWYICDGGIGLYDTFRVMLTAGNEVIVDTIIGAGESGDIVTLLSPPWIATDWGEFVVRLKVDTLNQIAESNEVNNADTAVYVVLPPNPAPIFNWIQPGVDTLHADSFATLKWFASDPEEPASVSIYYGTNPSNCTGTIVPGGSNRPVLEGIDSLVWNTRFLPTRRTYYMFAQVVDSQNDTCIYASSPVYVCHGCFTSVDQPVGGIPQEHFLAQNYPNPFNPRTEIRYGLAVPGRVTLRVYDLLGRERAVLLDDDHAPGSYAAEFDGSGYTSGLYFYVLSTPEGTLMRKMMLLK